MNQPLYPSKRTLSPLETCWLTSCTATTAGMFSERAMIAVCYFEKAMYEMSDEQLAVPGALEKLAAEVEARIQGGPSPRPLLTVPHILSDESSCYYHGYVLAEMAVHQTRAHFKRQYGALVDEPRVGADLACLAAWLLFFVAATCAVVAAKHRPRGA